MAKIGDKIRDYGALFFGAFLAAIICRNVVTGFLLHCKFEVEACVEVDPVASGMFVLAVALQKGINFFLAVASETGILFFLTVLLNLGGEAVLALPVAAESLVF